MELNVGIKNLDKKTNIKTIEVPDEMRERWATGLDYFDDALGGKGFAPSTCGIFTGEPGAGKTTMVLQLADALAGEHGTDKILFNTAEESLYQTRMVFDRLKLRNGFTVGQDSDVRKVIEHAQDIDASFILVDSIQTLWDEVAIERKGRNTMTDVRAMKSLTEWAKDNFKVVLAVGQVNKDGKFKGKNDLKHMVDLHLHLSINTDPDSEWRGTRELEVKKNRFGCSGQVYVLRLDEYGLKEI